LPAFLGDPFKPNLLIVVVVWVGLTVTSLWGAAFVYLIGLIQDSFSGLYLGLNGFSFLLTFLVLYNIAHRLYTDSRYLMTMAVFVATFANGLIQLLLLLLFSSAEGVYLSFLASLIPQGVLNAMTASVLFSFIDRPAAEVNQ
jgi:rod shape-determining protein MreD